MIRFKADLSAAFVCHLQNNSEIAASISGNTLHHVLADLGHHEDKINHQW
jgi:hypothetical protein